MTMHWDDCPDAVTDRGWLHLDDHPDREAPSWKGRGYGGVYKDDAPTACGNYLYYPNRGYHAVAYLLRVGPMGVSKQTIDLAAGPWFTSRKAAKDAIIEAVRHVVAAMAAV